MRGYRSNVDNGWRVVRDSAGSLLFDHPPRDSLAEKVWSPEVNVNQSIKTLFGSLQQVNTLSVSDSRVIHQQVQSSKFRFRRLEQPCAVARLGHVSARVY